MTAEDYARLAQQELATSELPAEEVLTRIFRRAMALAARRAEYAERERLPEKLRRVIEETYDEVFDIIMNKPATVEECIKKLVKVSPLLHEARHPSMHG